MLISHHIEFQEGGYAEDIDWVLQLFSVAETISFINEISYAYRQHRKGSASKNRSGPNYQAKMIEGWAERMIRENISNKKAVAGLLAFEYGICFGYWASSFRRDEENDGRASISFGLCIGSENKNDQKIQKDFRTSSYMYGNKDISVYTKAILWKNKSKKGEIRVWL